MPFTTYMESVAPPLSQLYFLRSPLRPETDRQRMRSAVQRAVQRTCTRRATHRTIQPTQEDTAVEDRCPKNAAAEKILSLPCAGR